MLTKKFEEKNRQVEIIKEQNTKMEIGIECVKYN